jgi:sulfur carrier protein ThiS
MSVRLILRGQEYEVKAGMTLRHAILKIGQQPEAVLATRAGEMITEDESETGSASAWFIAIIGWYLLVLEAKDEMSQMWPKSNH